MQRLRCCRGSQSIIEFMHSPPLVKLGRTDVTLEEEMQRWPWLHLPIPAMLCNHVPQSLI